MNFQRPPEGMYLHNLHPGAVVDVQTSHRTYRLECLGGDHVRISGHPSYCPTPVNAFVQGSSSKSGNFEAGFVGRGMHLIFRRADDQRDVVTSAIQSVRVEDEGDTTVVDAAVRT